jgi:hypothetical protein
MSENMIAILLYIGILLLAGTVLVLTIIYFVREPLTHTGSTKKTGEEEPATETTNTTEAQLIEIKQPKSKKVIKMPFIKAKTENYIKPVKEKKRFVKKVKENQPAGENTKPERKEMKLFKFRFGKDKSGITAEPAAAGNKEAVMPAPKAVTPPPQALSTVKPQPVVKPVTEVKTANITPPSPAVKNEAPKATKPADPIKAAPAAAPANAVKPAAGVIPPKPLSNSATANEKKPGTAEAAKKEPEVKMDNNNTKPGTSPLVEKPKTTAEAAKPAATVTASVKKPEPKSSLDDMSKMFSKEAVDDSEATKLAKDLKEVEVNNLIKDGQDLVALLKRNRS